MKRWVRQEILGMSRVGFASKYEIYVNTNDAGKIPHFHMRDKVDWDKFHTCIRIDKPEYFLHEGKEDILNAGERKKLAKFMESKVTIAKYKDKFENNWELTCFLWDMNNSDVMISDDIEMPDYNKLQE